MNNKNENLRNNISDLSKIALSTLEKNTIKKNIKTVKIESVINNEQNNIDEQELLELYVAKNLDKMDASSFNFAAAIFSFSYLLYRKLYIEFSIMMVLLIGLKILVTDNLIYFSMYVVTCVMCGVFFNKYYIDSVKRKISKIKDTYKDEEKIREVIEKKSKKNLILPILAGVVFAAVITLVMVKFKIAAIMIFILSLINSINITDYKYIKTSSKSFVNIVEKYNETAINEFEIPGEYKYIIDGKKYSFVAIPHNDDKKDISCSYDKKWTNTKGYEFAANSTTCEEYFKDIFENYMKNYDTSIISEAEIIISYTGKVSDKSYLKYDDVTCKYDSKKSEFKCSR